MYKRQDNNIVFFTETVMRSLELSDDVPSLIKPVSRTIYGLINAGEIGQAFDLWINTTEKAGIKNVSLPENKANTNMEPLNYNPDLLDIASPAPFNWTFYPGKDVLIENGLDNIYISFSGDSPKTVGMQYFKPPLGPLSLMVDGEYHYKHKQGNFFLNLKCLTQVTPEYILELDAKSNEGNIQKKTFDGFSENCTLASIKLIAQPGIFNERISANIRKISVVSSEAIQ